MNDYYRQERTVTTVRHVMPLPVNWVEMQKLLRVVIQDMGYGGEQGEPADDLIWYEADENELALCYELVSGTNGGPSNSKRLP
jgi:cephalosporin-C deacetylase-like acetyl esterase